MSEIEDAVRRLAKGVYPVEAGVELLIRQGKAIRKGAPWLEGVGTNIDGPMVGVLPETLWVKSRAWSGGERRVVDIAVSLIDSEPRVNLYDSLSGLDPATATLVVAALAHATGTHQARMPIIDGNKLVGYTEPHAIVEWPESTTEPEPRRTDRMAPHGARSGPVEGMARGL